MLFTDLGLSPKVLAAIEATGYTKPTEIQGQAIPPALEGKDVLGIAQTGTGKTAAFVLPMLTRLERGRARARMPRSLVLEPTRELAAQVAESLVAYGKNHKLTVALLIGGVSFSEQDKKLDRGADILIATPGRLLDHFERGKLMMNGVEILVVDEADRMLDMGFIPDIERIFKLTPFTRQTLFFSATMPPEIKRITDAFLHNPAVVEAARQATTAETITQRLVRAPTDPKGKRAVLRDIMRASDVKNAIIFCNRKRDVTTLNNSLCRHGFDAAAIHGDLDQHVRTETLDRFRRGTLRFLVASDVAARGLDIPAVSHIFNYDVPHHAEDYVHRIGRTGRAGLEGASFTLVTPTDRKSLKAIETLIEEDIAWAGSEPAAESAEEAPRRPRRGESRRAAPAPEPAPEPATAIATEPPEEETAKVIPMEPAKPARRRSRGDAKTDESDRRGGRRPRKPAEAPDDDAVFADTAYVPDFLLRPVRIAAK
jgi:superfamily II DNA/RNA helicase